MHDLPRAYSKETNPEIRKAIVENYELTLKVLEDCYTITKKLIDKNTPVAKTKSFYGFSLKHFFILTFESIIDEDQVATRHMPISMEHWDKFDAPVIEFNPTTYHIKFVELINNYHAMLEAYEHTATNNSVKY